MRVFGCFGCSSALAVVAIGIFFAVAAAVKVVVVFSLIGSDRQLFLAAALPSKQQNERMMQNKNKECAFFAPLFPILFSPPKTKRPKVRWWKLSAW